MCPNVVTLKFDGSRSIVQMEMKMHNGLKQSAFEKLSSSGRM